MLNNRYTRYLSTVLAAFLTASSLISCAGTAPVQRDYFVLSASQQAQAVAISGIPRASISRVTLPGYLNQQNIARQVSADKVALLTQSLWAEKLSQAIPAIIAGEIAAIVRNPIETHPLPPGIQIPTRVEINIRQFIATENQLRLQADYRIVNPPKLLSYRFSQNIPLADHQIQTLVNGYNDGLRQLAKAIANHL